MDWELAGDVAVGVGGALYVALAAILLRHSAGRPANVALALLFLVDAASEVCFMVGRIMGDLVWQRVGMYYGWAQSPLVLAFAAAYLGPATRLPRWATRLWPYALLAGGIAVWFAIERARTGEILFFDATEASAFIWANLLLTVSFGVVPILLARAAMREPAPRAASDVLLTTGVALWWASTTTETLTGAALGAGQAAPAVAAALARGVLTLWLIVLLARAPRARPDLRRVARLGLVAVIAAVGIGVAAGPEWTFAPAMNFASGVTWMILAPLTVAYAILRHQMLGVDVKVRFAISKSSLAAVFIAVFFVASEGAQVLFGQDNEIVGLVAAGGLVFALAPLQRAAERLAERAVPAAAVGPRSAAIPADEEDAYRAALRRFLAEGEVRKDEELALARIAAGLGIAHVRAVELRHEVEAEVDAG